MRLKPYLSRLLALVLVVVIGLMGCSASTTGLTGNYSQDTLTVIQGLTSAIDSTNEAQNKDDIRKLAREQINDYISRYRKGSGSSGLRSFTTMQTALNSLAGYYTAYGTRPLPEKLKKRLKQEFKQVELAIQRGI